MKDDLTPNEKYYVERYEFIHGELSRLQDDMLTIEQATAKLLNELKELREKETKQQKETDGEV